MKNKIKRFVSMLGPLSLWMLLPGGFAGYALAEHQWVSATINGAILVLMLGSNYRNNKKMLA